MQSVTGLEERRREDRTLARGSVRRVIGRTPRRRLLADRAARWIVSAGGLAVIASVLGILAFLIAETLPLLAPADVTPAGSFPVSGTPQAVLTDEHRSHVASLGRNAIVRVYRADGGQLVNTRSLLDEGDTAGITHVRALPEANALAAATDDGRIIVQPVVWRIRFEGSERVVEPELPVPVVLDAGQGGSPVEVFALGFAGELRTSAVLQADGSLHLARIEVEENDFTGEVSLSESTRRLAASPSVERLVLDRDQHNLFGVTRSVNVELQSDGDWRLSDAAPGDTVENVLRRVRFDAQALQASYRRKLMGLKLDQPLRESFLRELLAGLSAYTYLED